MTSCHLMYGHRCIAADAQHAWQMMARAAIVLAFLFSVSTAQEFNDDVPFSKSVSVVDVKAEIKNSGKPAVVFVTQPWCGACKQLKSSINGDAGVKVPYLVVPLQ